MERKYLQQEDASEREFGGYEEPEVQDDSPAIDAYMQPEEEAETQHEHEEENEGEKEKKVVTEKAKKININERISQVQREKFQALDELSRMKEENERLRSVAEMSTQTAMKHYDESVAQRLQSAKELKIKALESGDVHAQADADVALSMVTAELQNLNFLKAQQMSYQQQQRDIYPQQDIQPYVEQATNAWAEQNSWYDRRSEDHDEWLANEVNHYCNAFDNNLYKAGRGHEIMTPEYFEIIDKHVNALRNHRNQSRRGGDLNMKASRGTVAPVRGGYSNQSGQQDARQVKLTPDEKDMARRLGVDEKTYIQYRIDDETNNGHRRVRR